MFKVLWCWVKSAVLQSPIPYPSIKKSGLMATLSSSSQQSLLSHTKQSFLLSLSAQQSKLLAQGSQLTFRKWHHYWGVGSFCQTKHFNEVSSEQDCSINHYLTDNWWLMKRKDCVTVTVYPPCRASVHDSHGEGFTRKNIPSVVLDLERNVCIAVFAGTWLDWPQQFPKLCV